MSNTHDVGGVFGSPYGSNFVRRNVVAVCGMTGSGINSCQVQVRTGVPITLTAVPGSDDMFYQWSGGLCGGSTATTCTFTPQFSFQTETAIFSNA